MILSVPYSYDVKGFEGLRRTESSHKAAGSVDVMIEELTSDQAPLAAELSISGSSRRDEPLGTVAIRFVEGRGLLVPTSQTDFVPRPPPDATAFAEAVSRRETNGNPFAPYARHIPRKGSEEPRFNPRKRVWNNRDQVVAEINDIASGVVMVDGVPHGPCEEPLLKLSRKDVPERLGGEWLMNCIRLYTEGERFAYYGCGPDEVFRLDEWPRIKAELLTIASDHQVEVDLPDNHPNAVVHLPHAFKVETESMALVEMARSVYKDILFHIKNFGGMASNENKWSWRKGTSHKVIPPGIVKAWQALGEALHGEPLDEGNLERIVHAIETHRFEALPDRRDGSHDNPEYDRFVDMWSRASRTVERFRNRPSQVRSANLDSDDVEALVDFSRTVAT